MVFLMEVNLLQNILNKDIEIIYLKLKYLNFL